MAASEKTPEAFLSSLPIKLRSAAELLRTELHKIESSYEEKCAWKGLAFLRGDNYSCMIAPYKDHLKLMIWRGVNLEDPEERLHGSGLNTRHMVIRESSDINAPYLKSLLKQQFKLYDSGVPWEESCEVRKGGPMPSFIKKALEEHNLVNAFEDRPPYQQRDYIDWIKQAKRDTTKESRLAQMLDELAAGNRYMKMEWGRKK